MDTGSALTLIPGDWDLTVVHQSENEPMEVRKSKEFYLRSASKESQWVLKSALWLFPLLQSELLELMYLGEGRIPALVFWPVE